MNIERFFSNLNSPLLVTAVGASILVGTPHANVVLGAWPVHALQLLNIASFGTNVASVSIPGRIDGQEAERMRTGVDNEKDDHFQEFSTYNSRSLVTPSGWAFAIWGPIYIGETLFCFGSQFFALTQNTDLLLVPITTTFAATNFIQSLWCASFRPSYYYARGWTKFVSVAMLGGTAYSLSLLHKETTQNPSLGLYLLPMTVHFGWTTAATLVNLNGSISSIPQVSDTIVAVVGHASVLVATALGCWITIVRSSPMYGLTIAWALAACTTGMQKRLENSGKSRDGMTSARQRQVRLCQFGSIACTLASIGRLFFTFSI